MTISIQRPPTAPHPSQDKSQCTRLCLRLSTITTPPSTPSSTSFTNTFPPGYSRCFPDSEFGVCYSQYLEKLSVPCAYPILPVNRGPASPWGLTMGLYSSGWSRVACSTKACSSHHIQLTAHVLRHQSWSVPKRTSAPMTSLDIKLLLNWRAELLILNLFTFSVVDL